jgi:cytochrome c oxidase cbb3-type subunit 3
VKLSRRLPAIPITIVLLGLVSACSWMPGKPKPEEGWKRWSEIKDFGELYSHNCSGCHGANGRGGTAQQLNDPLYQGLVTDDTLRQVIGKGVPATSMPAFVDTAGGSLTAAQVDVLVAGMRSQWARPNQFSNVELPPYSLQNATAKGSGPGDPQRGAASYKTYCAHCHGEGGSGGGKAGSIVDQNYLAVVSDQSLRTIVITGRPDLKKPDWRSNLSGQAMTAQEISDVVAWLVSLRQGTETHAPSEVKVASQLTTER